MLIDKSAFAMLDRPVWHALAGAQLALSCGDGRARRLFSDFGTFAAPYDFSKESLAALGKLAASTEIWLLEKDRVPDVPGTQIVVQGEYLQMILTDSPIPIRSFDTMALGDTDVPDMMALAELTKPGPLFPMSHKLGRFLGVRRDGRLVAMAGERLKPGNFVEISGVCTHPDHRGEGLAADLIQKVAQRTMQEGKIPFLHCSTEKIETISLYRSMGFVPHDIVVLTVLQAQQESHSQR